MVRRGHAVPYCPMRNAALPIEVSSNSRSNNTPRIIVVYAHNASVLDLHLVEHFQVDSKIIRGPASGNSRWPGVDLGYKTQVRPKETSPTFLRQQMAR